MADELAKMAMTEEARWSELSEPPKNVIRLLEGKKREWEEQCIVLGVVSPPLLTQKSIYLLSWFFIFIFIFWVCAIVFLLLRV